MKQRVSECTCLLVPRLIHILACHDEAFSICPQLLLLLLLNRIKKSQNIHSVSKEHQRVKTNVQPKNKLSRSKLDGFSSTWYKMISVQLDHHTLAQLCWQVHPRLNYFEAKSGAWLCLQINRTMDFKRIDGLSKLHGFSKTWFQTKPFGQGYHVRSQFGQQDHPQVSHLQKIQHFT